MSVSCLFLSIEVTKGCNSPSLSLRKGNQCFTFCKWCIAWELSVFWPCVHGLYECTCGVWSLEKKIWLISGSGPVWICLRSGSGPAWIWLKSASGPVSDPESAVIKGIWVTFELSCTLWGCLVWSDRDPTRWRRCSYRRDPTRWRRCRDPTRWRRYSYRLLASYNMILSTYSLLKVLFKTLEV